MVYHAYEEGYSVLPRLKKLEGPIFVVDEAYDRFVTEKAEAVAHQPCFVEQGMTDELYEVLCDFIRRESSVIDASPAAAPKTRFDRLLMRLQEDVAVHRLDETTDRLACAHVCFPSAWRPEEKIGRPLAEIHAPVPGLRLDNSRKLVEAMVYGGPFERYVWGVIFEDRINGHPRFPKAKFDPTAPRVFVKIERQVTYGLPEFGAAAFVLRQHLLPEPEIDKPALVTALRGMTPEQRAYKGFDGCFDELIAYLS